MAAGALAAPRRPARWAAVVVAALALAACTRSAGTGPVAGRAARPLRPAAPAAPAVPPAKAKGAPAVPRFAHVFVVVMENLGYAQALALPYVHELATRFAVATQYTAVAHPSLPNYLALTSGRTWVTSDCWFCYVPGPDLGSELSRAGISWGAYMEGLPAACWLGPWWPPGDYAGKHDPFRYYLDIRGSRRLCAHIRPLTDLTAALGRPTAPVPRFVWVTPDLCHDGHDCPPAVADAWLRGFVPRILRSGAWQRGGVLFVTWDEANGDSTGGGGHVLTLVIAPGLPRGLRVAVPYNHYSLLRTVEEAWGLPLLGQSAAPGVRSLAAFWQAAGRVRGAAAAARPARLQ